MAYVKAAALYCVVGTCGKILIGTWPIYLKVCPDLIETS
jgi:hypothetical protein